ncbi:MAG: glycosyltransferase [Methylobacterium sp.]|jgi:GT2 family glycosyltransferase|uniref:glycosyltransferase family 2 protein n=1 Tax=Methylobacterium sp. TaxID=409 RepID=UPI0025F2D1AF|nr:glycosyltransferase [Methylobacterium sp.]MBX9930199.1 glycosyltransferase [Methylobacterium sp.]
MTRTETDAARIIETVVCVPTFRRPEHLARTLDSLVAQSFDRPFAVVVVENEPAPMQGSAVAEAYLVGGRLSGLCVTESRQGNVFAINTAFDTALAAYPDARFFLMIDDDEVAEPDWLARMVGAAEASGAGVVGGPVWLSLGREAKPGLACHPAFLPAYTESGPVPLIYGSGNCLVTRETFEGLGLPAFDVGYNFLGGGDADFFARARRAQVRFHWVAEAIITETVPPLRTTLGWLAARALRTGAINYRIECKHAEGLAGRAGIGLKSVAMIPVALLRALRLLAGTRDVRIAINPILIVAGRWLAAVGIEPQPYRAPAAR